MLMPRTEAAGIDTYYQQIGQGPTILLLHGWRNNWQSWSPLIAQLATNYQLLIPDLPGFGQTGTSSPDGWQTKDYTNWLQDFLKKTNTSQLSAVIGHSYGAKVAAWHFLQSATSLKPTQGLFLIGPSGIPNKLSWYKKILKSSLPLVPLLIKRKMLVAIRPWIYRQLDADSDYLQSTPWQEKTLQKILTEDIRRQVKQSSSLPLHLCFGQHDEASPLWMAYQWLPLSKKSEVFVVPQAEHHLHLTHTSLVNNWLETYL